MSGADDPAHTDGPDTHRVLDEADAAEHVLIGYYSARLRSAEQAWRSVRGDAPTQPPTDADEPTPWDDLPAADHHLTLALCYAARATRNAVGSSEPRLTSTTAAWMAEWLIDHGWAPVPVEDEADGLTAEQYRHIYTDLIRGLAVDLGLDPEKAGGGSITAAVRRLVADVSVPQKSTESPDGDTAAPDGGAS